MKNILVDALRQSRTDSAEEDAGSPAAIQAPVTPSTNDTETADVIAESKNTHASMDLELLPDAERESATPIIDDEESEYEPSLDQTRRLRNSGARLDESPSILVRVGRASPIACLVALSVSAGAYVVYQNLAAANLNDDLNELSSQVRQDVTRNDDEWESIPEPGSVFAFTGARPVVSPDIPVIAASPPGDRPATVKQARLTAVSRALAQDIDPAFPIVARAYAAYSNNDLNGAERLYREALDVTPHNLDALAGLASVLALTARTEDAIAAYEKLLLVDPANAIAMSAVLARAAGKPAGEVETEIKLLLQKYPDNAHLHFALGLRYTGAEYWPRANFEFTKAQQLDPSNGDYNYNLAVSLERLGRSDEAAAYYEQALISAETSDSFDRQLTEQHLRRLTASWGEF